MRPKRILSMMLALVMLVVPMAMSADAAIILVWPVPGHTTLSQGYHDGNAIDISDGSIAGATVVAAMGGTVTRIYLCSTQHLNSGDCNGFGTGLVISGDDGRTYSYAHMAGGSIPSNVYYGARVSAGQVIGAVGTTGWSTGNHLHFAISNTANYWDAGPNPQNEYYIYDIAVPSNLSISTDYSWYDISETVTINMSAHNATQLHMALYKNDTRIEEYSLFDHSSGTFTMSANKYGAGEYSAYFTACNPFGYVDSGWIYFSIGHQSPIEPEEPENAVVGFSLDTQPVKAGDTKLYADLVVTLPEDATGYELGSFALSVSYDSSVMSLSKMAEWHVSGTLAESESIDVNPYMLLWLTVSSNERFSAGSTVAATLTFDLAKPAVNGNEYFIDLSVDENNGVSSLESADGTYETIHYSEGQISVTGATVTVCDQVVPGDANGDGRINLGDVTMLLQYIAKWDVSPNVDAADVTGDGTVNLSDVTLMLQYIAGWNVTLK